MATTVPPSKSPAKGPIDPGQLKGRRFGRVLTKLGKVTREQVYEALQLQKTRREKGQQVPIGELLVELGYIIEADVMEALAGQAGMRLVQVDPDAIPKETIDALPAETANTYQVIPLEYDESRRAVTIAMKSPDNFRAVDDLRLLMGFKVDAVVAPAAQIDAVLQKHYSGTSSSSALRPASVRKASGILSPILNSRKARALRLASPIAPWLMPVFTAVRALPMASVAFSCLLILGLSSLFLVVV